MIVLILMSVLLFSALSGSEASPVVPLYDTIIIGLGSSGTTAASILARAGKRVLALEAQDRVGGRVWTRHFGDGVVEAGAEWIHGLVDSRVYELAVQNNVSISVDENSYTKVYCSNGSGVSDLLTELMDYGFQVMDERSDINESMAELIGRRLREHFQNKSPEFLNNKEAFDNFLDLMNLIVGSYEASDYWTDVTARKGYDALEGTQNGSWNRYGYETFFKILLNIYNNGPGLPTMDIKLNKEVTNIQWPKESTGNVVVTCKNGDQYSAPNVIVTVSLGVLKDRYSSLFSPPLPQEKVTAIQVLSIGVVDKIILHFNESWPVKDDMMFYWRPEDRKQVSDEDKWITKVLGTSAPTGASNVLTLWTVGNTAKLVEWLPEDVVQSKALELLQRFVGPNVTVPQPVAMIRTTWYSNPFTRGSYTFDTLETANHPELRQNLAVPLMDAAGTPRVLFAGEATHSTRFATVHGASDSGYREAQRILSTYKL